MLSQPNESEAISHRQRRYIARAKRAYRLTARMKGTMNEKTIRELAVELTVETTAVCEGIKGKSVFVNQLLRACSSIGANAHEAKYAQSRADFVNKMEIALKESYETEYWLEILFKIGALDETVYKKLNGKCDMIRRKLIASIKTAKRIS